jgi:hypothetical protein
LFIPYDDGYFLVADRQNTLDNGFKAEIKKLHLQSDNGPAIGGAGYTSIIQNLYSELGGRDLTACQNICKEIGDTLAQIIAKVYEIDKLTGVVIRSENLSPEMFMVANGDSGVSLFHFYGATYMKIDDLSVIGALAEKNQRITDYLGRNTCKLPEEKAVLLGKEILTQMAFSDNSIGPPEYHGFDLIRITREGKFTAIPKGPIIRKMDASSVFEYIQR